MSRKIIQAALAGGSLCAGALLASPTYGQTLASDDFTGVDLTTVDPVPNPPNGRNDSSTTAAGLDGVTSGTGFGTAWNVQNDDRSTPGYNVTATTPLSLNGGNYATGGDSYQGSGRVFDATDTGTFATSGLRNGDFDGGGDGTASRLGTPGSSLLITSRFRIDSTAGDEKFLQVGRNGDIRFGVNSNNDAIVFGDVDGSQAGSQFYTLSSNGVDVTSTAAYTPGVADLLVVRVDYGATGVGDPSATDFAVPATLQLFVNPTDPSNPTGPAAATLVSTNATFSALGFYGGNGAGRSSFDDFSITVAPPIPEPAGLALLGVAGLVAARRRRA